MQPGIVRNAAPIYRADPHWCDQVRKTRQKLAEVCSQCVNRRVRVEMMDGRTYEGVVVGHDNTYLHLSTGQNRFFGPFATAAILPLVLFDLLAITLFF